MNMTIRLETEKDYRAVEELTREAFWNVYKPGADEHYYVNQMRNHPDFIPELAFVLEKDGKIIGNIMYIADWVLFYEKKKVEISYPLISVLFPLCYGIFIFIYAAIYKFDSSVLNYFGTGPLIYPYFFLNIETYGVGGVCLWMLGLGAVFVGVRFIFMGIDRLLYRLT